MKNKIMFVIAILIIAFSSNSIAETIYDESAGGLAKYGPDFVIKTDTEFVESNDTVFHDTPIANTTVNQSTADLISQIVIVNQGAGAVATTQANIEQNGPAAVGTAIPTPNNNVSVTYGTTQANVPGTSNTTSSLPMPVTSQVTGVPINTLNYATLTTKNITGTTPTISGATCALINASTNQIYFVKTKLWLNFSKR